MSIMHRSRSATGKFKHLEILRARTKHDEAQALNNTRRQGAEERDAHWRGVAEENERLRQELAELRASQK